MSTHAEISAAVVACGYRDCPDLHSCLTRGCATLLDHRAILAGVPGCMVECARCIEKRMGASLGTLIERMRQPRKYPTSGRITCDDPSIYGSEVLGWEGSTWESFNRRHEAQISNVCPEPYRRGIGQGFGATEDGEAE